jgi:hypothetical protein
MISYPAAIIRKERLAVANREHDSSATLRLSLLHFEIRKSSQVPRIHVRDGPEFESIAIPMQNIIAVLFETLHGFSATGFRWRYEQIDSMFITLVDERRYFPTIYVIQPTSD